MSDYELYHASTRKHKYIKKIGNRYFYTTQEIAAYLNSKRKDVTFEKGETEDYDDRDPKTGKSPKMKEYRIDFNKHDGGRGKGGWSDGVGVKIGNKKIEFYNTKNDKYFKDGERSTVKRTGRLKSEYYEDGSHYTIDLSDKKTFEKRKKKAAADKLRGKTWTVKYNTDRTVADIVAENEVKKKKKTKKKKKRKDD